MNHHKNAGYTARNRKGIVNHIRHTKRRPRVARQSEAYMKLPRCTCPDFANQVFSHECPRHGGE